MGRRSHRKFCEIGLGLNCLSRAKQQKTCDQHLPPASDRHLGLRALLGASLLLAVTLGIESETVSSKCFVLRYLPWSRWYGFEGRQSSPGGNRTNPACLPRRQGGFLLPCPAVRARRFHRSYVHSQ